MAWTRVARVSIVGVVRRSIEQIDNHLPQAFLVVENGCRRRHKELRVTVKQGQVSKSHRCAHGTESEAARGQVFALPCARVLHIWWASSKEIVLADAEDDLLYTVGGVKLFIGAQQRIIVLVKYGRRTQWPCQRRHIHRVQIHKRERSHGHFA